MQKKIEALLFISIKPLSVKALQELVGAKKKEEVIEAIEALMKKYNTQDSGIALARVDDKVQMTTASSVAPLITEFLKDEMTGELTPASLETLTVIAYRGPITKTELEMIRGVNCTLILKNLLMRGLIEEKKDKDELLSVYQVTFDFLKYLGLQEVAQLPEYAELHASAALENLLNPQQAQDATSQIVDDTSNLET